MVTFEKFQHKNVDVSGSVKGGGAVITEGAIRMSVGEGCGLPGCHCSEGIWITIIMPRTKDGIVEGIQVRFRNKSELNDLLEYHEVRG